MQSLVSVIVPAYNSEKTIKKCILSIINQTYKNLQIIIVNDGSTDETVNIIKLLASEDERIRIIDINNSGVSHARNVGIDNANGEYITFVDSDDTIELDMYTFLYEIMNKYNAQIAHCSYNNITLNNECVPVGNSGRIIRQNHDEALSCIISGELFAGGTCNKMYKADLFCNIRFDEKIKFNEDVLINYLLFNKVKTSVYSDKAFYNYYASPISATHSANAVKAGEECFYVAEKIFEMSKDKTYENLSKHRMAYTALVLYRAYLFNNNKNNSSRIKLKKKILEWYKRGVYTKKSEKLTVKMYKYIPHLYVVLYNVYDKIRVKKLDPKQ